MKAGKTIKTSIAVRVIAKGGKFLGDDIHGASVTIRHGVTKELLASGRVQGGSGDLYGLMVEPRPRTEPLPIQGASVFMAEIESTDYSPIPLEISATGPGAGLQSVAGTSTTQWIVPGLTEGKRNTPVVYSCTIELPGLLVQVMNPATHLNITQKLPQTISFEVNIAMMCGCPIDDHTDADGPHHFPNPWPVEDFIVGCYISCAGQETEHVQLKFDAANAPGRYTGQWKMKAPGFYSGHFYAYQISQGNTGAATVSFFSIPPAKKK